MLPGKLHIQRSLQAHAALYQWHRLYKLDDFPFKKCPASTVLGTVRRFATDYGLRKHTLFYSEVVAVKREEVGCARCAFVPPCSANVD